MIPVLTETEARWLDETTIESGWASGSVLMQRWPEFRKDSLASDEALVVVQVNGKLRSKFNLAASATEDQIKETALADPKIVKYTGGNPPKKVIVIRKKQTLVNIVV